MYSRLLSERVKYRYMALKRIFAVALLSLSFVTTTIGSPTNGDLLKTFETSLKEMGCYCVEFVVSFEEYSSSGRYVVDGDNFYVQNEDIEVYAYDGVKYEINRSRKEVTIDSVASLGSDIISNPSRGFTALAEGYDVVTTEVEGRKTLLLTPKQGATTQSAVSPTERVAVVADASGRLPAVVRYEVGTDAIEVRITSITKAEILPRFRAEQYGGFEVVDLR